MRFTPLALYAMLALFAGGCGDQPAPNNRAPCVDFCSSQVGALRCVQTETVVALDIPGPGRPTPEEAVAPYAEGLTLVVRQDDDGMTVLGVRADQTVARVFDVTKHDDGWWPDGYRQCSS